jgi:hypothetical protein
MEASEVLKIVANGLASQGGPAYESGACLYRASGGRKCAAGWIITDEEIMRGVRSMNLSSLKHEGTLPKSCEEHFSLLELLQEVHDSCALNYSYVSVTKPEPDQLAMWKNVHGPCGIATKLRRVARENDLDPEIVTEAFKNYGGVTADSDDARNSE